MPTMVKIGPGLAYFPQWDGLAVLLPRQQSRLGVGAEDEEYAMTRNLRRTDAVIGIDIGRNLNPCRWF
jgi:hypothetical protein